jgi:gliding motility-associated-like protein
MKNFKILVIALLGLITLPASASHLLGGEIYWECTANGQFRFTLVLYRDCTGITLPTTSATINGPQGNITCQYISQLSGDVSPNCPNTALDIECASGDIGAIEKYVYVSTPQPLTGTPPPGGWEFSYSSCCRPQIENTNASGYYLRSVMYPYTPPGAAGPITASALCDNSPQFAQDANGVTCPDFKYTFNHLPSDKDVDSLVFGWADPLDGANSPISWDPGFNNTNPMPDAGENPLNGPNTLDPLSGEMTFESYNPTNGWYATCVSIKEYRCNQLIGEVFRDVPFHILPLADCGGNPTTPSAEIDTSIYTNISRNGNIYRTQVYPQDTVAFRLTGQDLDQFGGGGFQTICMKAGGLQLNGASPNSSTGCDGLAPCATLTSANPNGTYCNTIQNNVDFLWVPDCVHLQGTGCGSANNTYFFTIRMEDNGCPAPKVGLATIVVEVLAGDPTPPPLQCLDVRLDGTVRLTWDQPELDSALGFNYYRIYGSSAPNGPWSVVDSIPFYDTLSTVLPVQGANSYFYAEMSTGPCDFVSRPSEVVGTMSLTLTPTPPGSPEYAQLSWTPLTASGLPSSSAGVYEVWVEAPTNSGNWTKKAEVTGTSYTDTVSVCDMNVQYQVRVQDTTIGCFNGSEPDTGTFRDLTNSLSTQVSRVFVNENNNASVEWNTDSVDDIVSFYLLFNDPRDGWVVVDTIEAGSPSPYEWPGSMADTRSEEFKVITVDSCGNESDDLAVDPNRTVYLRNRLDKCNGVSRLSWNAYEEFPNGVHGYRVYMQETINGNQQPPQLLFTAGPNDTTYTQTVIEKDVVYCYVVEAFDSVANLSSTSNQLCVEAEVPQQSRELYVATVTNDLDREALELNVIIDAEADVQSFDITRAPEYFGPYETIATLGKPADGSSIIQFLDFGVEPERLDYYYRITATDSCGGRDTVSNISRNIRLTASSKADLSNRLTWTPYMEWGGTVGKYEIYRRKGDFGTFNKIAENDGNDTTFSDFEIADLIQADPEAGKYCYYVKAVELSNPNGFVTNTGEPYSAMSNDICVTQKVRMYMATAFRPSSSVPENQVYGPSMELDDVDEYQFYIMNRWGKKVFETADPAQKWDGDYENKEAPQGVYIYYVRYATPGDKVQEERGNFTLIR